MIICRQYEAVAISRWANEMQSFCLQRRKSGSKDEMKARE